MKWPSLQKKNIFLYESKLEYMPCKNYFLFCFHIIENHLSIQLLFVAFLGIRKYKLGISCKFLKVFVYLDFGLLRLEFQNSILHLNKIKIQSSWKVLDLLQDKMLKIHKNDHSDNRTHSQTLILLSALHFGKPKHMQYCMFIVEVWSIVKIMWFFAIFSKTTLEVVLVVRYIHFLLNVEKFKTNFLFI